jgi:hypothetical protein
MSVTAALESRLGVTALASACVLALSNVECGRLAADEKPACDGRLVDTTSDLDNCGACGSSCRAAPPSTASCVAGRCLVDLASGQGHVDALAVGATHAYWTSSGEIFEVPLDGGTPVVAVHADAGDIAVDTANIYWTVFDPDTNDGAIMKRSLAGGDPIVLASTSRRPSSIAVDGESVYWTAADESGLGEIARVPVGGGEIVLLAAAESDPGNLVVGGGSAYWSSPHAGTCSGALRTVPIAGGSPTTVYSGPWPDDLATDGRDLFYAQRQDWRTGSGCLPPGGEPRLGYRGIVGRVKGDGTSALVLASAQPLSIAVAVDEASVYWGNDAWFVSGIGSVVKVPKGGGDSVVVVADHGYPSHVRVDARSLYYATNDIPGSGCPTGACVVKVTPK